MVTLDHVNRSYSGGSVWTHQYQILVIFYAHMQSVRYPLEKFIVRVPTALLGIGARGIQSDMRTSFEVDAGRKTFHRTPRALSWIPA